MLSKNERKNYNSYALRSADSKSNTYSILDNLSNEYIEAELDKVSVVYSLDYLLEEVRKYYSCNGHTPITVTTTINGQTTIVY